MVHWRWRCVSSKYLLAEEMIAHQMMFLLEDTIVIADQLVKTKESLNKILVPEVVIKIDQEKTVVGATEADLETVMVVATEAVTEKEIIAKVQTDQIEVATTETVDKVQTGPIEVAIEIETPAVVQTEAVSEIEIKVPTEAVIETEEIVAKVLTEADPEVVVEVKTVVVLKKEIETLVVTDPIVAIVTNQKENIKPTTGRMQFLIL